MRLDNNIIRFQLPKELACPLPTEDRGIKRDEVKLLVTSENGQQIHHTKFKNIHHWLQAGDVLVVNTSATSPAAINIDLPNGRKGILHLSNKINQHEWLAEIREIIDNKTHRWKEGREGMTFQLPGDAELKLKERFYNNENLLDLWIVKINTQYKLLEYLQDFGQPIKYDKINKQYPISYYQTFFSFHPGSSEMPSAGRGFTNRTIDNLLNKDVSIAPILLHTGVSSLEENEKPYPEYMEISPVSASIINTAKRKGKRVIAVGTTAIRAIESAVNDRGFVVPFKGNTDLFIEENHQLKIASGLLTGFHEPKASHLHMLQAIGSFQHIERAYLAALENEYYWHEFGDLHLILT